VETVMINMLDIIFCQAFCLVSMQGVTVSVICTSEKKSWLVRLLLCLLNLHCLLKL